MRRGARACRGAAAPPPVLRAEASFRVGHASPLLLPPLAALKDESALFRHDVAFCLGQRQDPAAVQVLTSVLHDAKEHPMCVSRARRGVSAGRVPVEAVLSIVHPCCIQADPGRPFWPNPATLITQGPARGG